MNKQKFLRRVLPLIVVVCLIGALGTVFYLRTIKEPPPTPDELWPEQDVYKRQLFPPYFVMDFTFSTISAELTPFPGLK